MPYRASGKTVLKETSDGKWVVHKRHASAAKAEGHASALNINVHHPEKAKEK